MKNRPLAAALAALCLPGLLTAGGPASGPNGGPGKPPLTPAEFFPSHTFFYVQMNPAATVRGVKGLKLGKLLEDPNLRGLVDQAMQSIPQGQSPEAMLQRYPFDKALGERIAIGLIGLRTKVSAFGQARSARYPEDGPLPADLLQQNPNILSDTLLAIEVKDEVLFKRTILQLLSDMVLRGQPPETSKATVQQIEMDVWNLPMIGKVYHLFHEGYFLLAQSGAAIAEAIERQSNRRASLASRADFDRFRQHRGEKTAAGFVHVGLDSLIELASPLIPAAQRREIEAWGGFDFSGFQFGLGFCKGGICEWMHLAFAENPKGILMNLARLIPSVGYAETETHRGLAYSASVTFDWAAGYNATSFLLDLCDVSTRQFERNVKRELGMDLRKDLMAALGNTIGVVGLMPRLGFIPEVSFVFQVRNRARMEAVLAKLKSQFAANHIKLKEFTVPGGNPKATYLNLGKDIPVKPAFVLCGDKLVISPMPLMLKYAVRKSRRTGYALVDFVPDGNKIDSMARFAYFYDPAPMAENLYADLLKMISGSGQLLPIDALDLPSPEFVASTLSRVGVDVAMSPYYLTMDLHSPFGIALPTMVGSAVAMQMQQQQVQQQIRTQPARPRSNFGGDSKPAINKPKTKARSSFGGDPKQKIN